MAAIFVEMFSYDFILRALIVGVLVSLCSALLGVSLVLKRYSMIGDGLSHVGFSALAFAMVLNVAPLYVAIPVVVSAAFLLLRLSENSKIRGDAAIAMISSGSLALGVFAISVTKGMNVDMSSYMFGSILAMFHSFYNQCRVLGVNKDVQQARLLLIKAVGHTLKHSLSILGVSAPEHM